MTKPLQRARLEKFVREMGLRHFAETEGVEVSFDTEANACICQYCTVKIMHRA